MRGRPVEHEEVELTLLLRRGSAPGAFPDISALGATPALARRYLDRPGFGAAHGARPEDLECVRDFADAVGGEVLEADAGRRAVRLAGRAADLATAFGVIVERAGDPRAPFRRQAGQIRLPSELVGAVVGVFGLDESPRLRPHLRRNADPAAVGYAVPSVGEAYGFPAALTGAGETIGILEFGGGYRPADLERFFSGLGLAVPAITAVSVDGAANAPTGDPNGPDAEVELDLEVAGALAPGARLVVYFAPNTEQGFVDAVTTAVHDATNRPSLLSISWGGPEQSWSAAARVALETAAQDGAVQGVGLLAASGDQGAADGEATGALAVDFPASSPYVLGCGGTRLVLEGTTIASEVVWNDLAAGEGATGGGVSVDFPLPSYQAGAGVPVSPDGQPGRGVPDVAADADPETGYAVVVDGAAADIGGTSAATPLWAALLARFGEALGRPIGYVNPLLYATAARATFRPITAGGNGGYAAGPGWNACCGLGSPQATKLLAALQG